MVIIVLLLTSSSILYTYIKSHIVVIPCFILRQILPRPSTSSVLKYCCVHSDCEAEPASAAAGGRKQRTLQARGDPVLCHCGVLAY